MPRPLTAVAVRVLRALEQNPTGCTPELVRYAWPELVPNVDRAVTELLRTGYATRKHGTLHAVSPPPPARPAAVRRPRRRRRGGADPSP